MSEISQKVSSLKDLYNRKVGNLEATQQRLAKSTEQLNSLVSREESEAKASLFLQSLSDQARLHVLGKISQIVTDALQTVKDKNLEFTMQLVTERNQPTLNIGILDKLTGQTYSILDSMGGGIADIVCICLRVALLCKWQPSLSRVLILDEAGKHISVVDQELLATFISKLSTALNIQFIWITHSEILTKSADRIFEVTKHDGISKVEEKPLSV